MTRFSSVVIGNESLLVQCCEALLARGNTIAAIVTRNADVADWARDHDLVVEAPGQGLEARLGDAPFDWLLSIANLDILGEDVLALPKHGTLNFHDGPLPRHAGLNAPVWAMIEGETQHGISWHLIEGGVDEGDVLAARSFDITPQDTALTLNTKAYSAAIDSFGDVLDQLESGQLRRTPQDLARRSYHALADRPAGFGLLPLQGAAADAERLVRALDHGAYWNPLCIPKLWTGTQMLHVGGARLTESHAAAGTVLDVTADSLTVAFESGALVLTGLTDSGLNEIRPTDVAKTGDVLSMPDADVLARMDETAHALARHDGFWRGKLIDLHMLELPFVRTGSGDIAEHPLTLPDGAAGLARVATLVARMTGAQTFDLPIATAATKTAAQDGIALPWQPLKVDVKGTLSELETRITQAVDSLQNCVSIASDLAARSPEITTIAPLHLAVSLGAGAVSGAALTVELTESGARLHHDEARLAPADAALIAARLELMTHLAADAEASEAAILPASERDFVLNVVNDTVKNHDSSLTMHRAFETQVAQTPDATALVFEAQSLSYAALNARANRAAHVLRDMGVAPGTIVGLCCRRSVDLLVGALAILKAGGAYLPMDPSYPADRLRHFVDDSATPVIVTQASVEPNLPQHNAQLLVLDAEPRISAAPEGNLPDTSTPEDLAYLIYTSGSTGKPKGVMIEHRNVLNFYTGMDAHIPHDQAGTWLAVTSLSFDISVLELFWTTARGFKVVLTSDEDRGMISKGPLPTGQGMEFSLYYWGNDDGVGPDKYKTLIEGARFADDNGFVAVWTPERHFHAFGGPYPNPSVTGAAVAGFTRNIGVRGGSVVAPLHHPARIAEEWAVIDNLTNGKAGMAIASGWQPDDFVLRPENTPPANKPAMIESIETLRKLWRGEAVAFPKQDGSLHEVVTQPRPVSKDLPVWVTTAGNPETWKEAGRLGCNVLTHLLGQSIDEVAGKIKLYHAALREAGFDPAERTVTLMLHTCLADTRDAAREIAREPMKGYLRSAAGLIKQYAWAFPAFKRPEGVKNPFQLDLGSLSEEDLEGILDFAFDRYFNDSGLFGTIEDAVQRAEDLSRIGVTEIACLIDYGIAPDQVLEGLKPLAEVVKRAQMAPELPEDDFSIAAQILRHEVTHLQCTPSMARMIAMNDEARFALSRVSHVFVGGEPLPGALVREFAQITDATVTNMYGPTETTIWSSVEPASADEMTVNIGRPLANQRLYLLDDAQAPVGIGQEGELWIGGEGVTRGYWNRADLTAERFVDNPFHPGRMYRTGDLVRRRTDGRIDYVGRVDFQVKLRGHRIELGEIEATLEAQAAVTQAVVIAREDTPGDVRLIGYYTGTKQDDTALKASLTADLPAIMVPSRFVHLDVFPLTPNKKIDRNALPAPQAKAPRVMAATPKPVAPSGAAVQRTAPSADDRTEDRVGLIWSQILGVESVSGNDNFFDLGGHSLLAVQAHRMIRDELGAKGLSITDVFRFPVLSDLAARVAELVAPAAPRASTAVEPAANPRAQSRSDAMARRRAMRARRSA